MTGNDFIRADEVKVGDRIVADWGRPGGLVGATYPMATGQILLLVDEPTSERICLPGEWVRLVAN